MGIKKYIESPDVMWEHFLAYKVKLKKILLCKGLGGKDATDVYREKRKTALLLGFKTTLTTKIL